MRKAFICPTKYVQGEDEILNLGYFVKTFGESALLIAHPDDVNRVREKLERTAEKFQIQFIESGFCGQCSGTEVSRQEEQKRLLRWQRFVMNLCWKMDGKQKWPVKIML